MEQYYIYILFNQSRTLYIGVTSDLEVRMCQHRMGTYPGFASKYHLNQLAYYEIFGNPMTAIEREKQLKGWKRDKKVKLIESLNPHWDDLSETLADHGHSPGLDVSGCRGRILREYAQDDRTAEDNSGERQA